MCGSTDDGMNDSTYNCIGSGRGARGARAPPTFTRRVLSTPILNQLLRHGNHMIIMLQRVFLGAFGILLFWATLELQGMIPSSASWGCAPRSRI